MHLKILTSCVSLRLTGMSRRWSPVTLMMPTSWPMTLVIAWRCGQRWTVIGCFVSMGDWRGLFGQLLCSPSQLTKEHCERHGNTVEVGQGQEAWPWVKGVWRAWLPDRAEVNLKTVSLAVIFRSVDNKNNLHFSRAVWKKHVSIFLYEQKQKHVIQTHTHRHTHTHTHDVCVVWRKMALKVRLVFVSSPLEQF